MKRLATVAFCAAALLAQTKRPVRKAATPKPTTIAGYSTLTLDPANPHYFRFRGRTTAFITSGEHYGAVLNTKFDIPKYLDTLAENHLNLTRIFNGAYLEPVDSTPTTPSRPPPPTTNPPGSASPARAPPDSIFPNSTTVTSPASGALSRRPASATSPLK